MGTGIFGASLTTLTNGTTANAPDVLGNDQALKSNGVNNDGGLITTDGNGNGSFVGLLTTGSIAVTGTTSGTATLYQMFIGNLKAYYLYYNGYRNSTSTEQKIALPVAFTSYASFFAPGAIPPTHFFASGSQVTSHCEIVTGLPAGSGAGTISAQSAVNGFSYGDITAAFDTIGLGVSQGQAFLGGLLLIGN